MISHTSSSHSRMPALCWPRPYWYKHLLSASASSVHLGCSIHVSLCTLVRNQPRRSGVPIAKVQAAGYYSPCQSASRWRLTGTVLIMFRWMLQCQWSSFWEYRSVFMLMIPRSSLSHKFLCFLSCFISNSFSQMSLAKFWLVRNPAVSHLKPNSSVNFFLASPV